MIASVKRRHRDLEEFFDKESRTQEWLAEQLGINRSYVSLLASGKRQPSLGLALRIETLTGVPIKSLLRESSEAVA